MATKLPVNTGGTDAGKKLWDKHQADEYKRVNQYKEGLCFNCFKSKALSATIVDICKKCGEKRGPETVLAYITQKYYGMCFFCGKYDNDINNLNVRLCEHCHLGVAKIIQSYNDRNGMYGSDPFWIKMRKVHGKDWLKLLSWTPKKSGL